MDLYLQMGWGMMALSRELFRRWEGGSAILSPRDLEPERLPTFAQELRQMGVGLMVDPQFFLPRADHQRLTSHDYWPENFDTQEFDEEEVDTFTVRLAQLNEEIDTEGYIVPGWRAVEVDDVWRRMQLLFRTAARNRTDRPIIATICLSSEVVRSEEQIASVIEIEEKDVADCYYLILEKPGSDYLSDDPQWLANCLDLVAGLKRLGARVIVGYSNQQQLIMASAGADAIASGTFMNVRSFPPSKFIESEGDIRQRAVWYYLPQALSEFKLQFLDIAMRLGLADQLEPDLEAPYLGDLISEPQPSTSGWGEYEAFRHYLHSLRRQANQATRPSFRETVDHHQALNEKAEMVLERLHSSGVFGQHRDFSESIDAHRSALTVLERTQGPVLARDWSMVA